LGHAELTAPLERADDWAWVADHSVQIGREKCLAILGIRLRDLPAPGESLRHEMMELIALVPRKSWTRKEVDDALEASIERTGAPRVIVDDHGVDLAGGVELFQSRHPDTVEIYDVKHKAACLLKHRLERNPRWLEFMKLAGATRCAIQQTDLAALVPPAPHTKSRFMNLETHLRWADYMLVVLDDPPEEVTECASRNQVRKKLGWLSRFRRDVKEWASWQAITDKVVKFVNRQGLYRGIVDELRGELPRRHQEKSAKELAGQLTDFVAGESDKARRGERLPGSSEVLESCFAKFKALERDQCRGGFTSLVIAFGSLLIERAADTIAAGLRRSPTRAVIEWCRQNLGSTLAGKRKAIYNYCATKLGRK
jgi:hypothetical protein